MKHLIFVTLASFILVITSGGQGLAQSKKERSFSGTHYYGHTPKVYKLDEEQMIIQFETLGVRVNDSGDGPFHETSVNLVGVMYRGKEGSRLRAFETWTDSDGDKLIWELVDKKAEDSPPGTTPGTAKVFSGTGKYTGMEGTMDFLVRNPKSFPAGTGRGICREEVTLVPSN
ncbi:MAG: hypothetical protein WAK95_09635 [Desulfobacterales bacterium]